MICPTKKKQQQLYYVTLNRAYEYVCMYVCMRTLYNCRSNLTFDADDDLR